MSLSRKMSPAARSNEMWLYSQTSHNNINSVEKILQRMTLMIYIIYLLKDVTFYLDFFQVLLKKKSYDKRW